MVPVTSELSEVNALYGSGVSGACLTSTGLNREFHHEGEATLEFPNRYWPREYYVRGICLRIYVILPICLSYFDQTSAKFSKFSTKKITQIF